MPAAATENTLLIEIMADGLTGSQAKDHELFFAQGLFEKLELLGFTTDQSRFSPFSGPGRLAASISHLLSTTLAGQALTAIIGGLLETHLARMENPVNPKRREMADPLNLTSLVLLHGDQVLPVTLRGLSAGRTTYGHQQLGRPAIELAQADDYAPQLRGEGRVMAKRERRVSRIEHALDLLENALDIALYRETTSTSLLLEEEFFDWHVIREQREARHADFDILHARAAETELPELRLGNFDPCYLNPGKMPPALLDTVLRELQLLPVRDGQGRLQPGFAAIIDQARAKRFLMLADTLAFKDLPRAAPVNGIEQQTAERLAAACGQFTLDRETTMANRLQALARMPFIGPAGTQRDRLQRVAALAASIAGQSGEDAALTAEVARLFLQDLACATVMHYPHLHGIIGKYLKDENQHYLPVAVQASIEAALHPCHVDDSVPTDRMGAIVAVADKLDTLVAHDAAGHTAKEGDSPHGMHVEALAIGRLLMEQRLPIDLPDLIVEAKRRIGAPALASDSPYQLIMDRLVNYLQDAQPYRKWKFVDTKLQALQQARPRRLDTLLDDLAEP
jgi:glycyl-tRNA synthetase beta chain